LYDAVYRNPPRIVVTRPPNTDSASKARPGYPVLLLQFVTVAGSLVVTMELFARRQSVRAIE